jgi:serine phosphatase RsbU (regulator of sigma subunit)
LQKGDRLYLITDGFADQFGGEKGKKYKRYHLEELLNNTQQDSLELQKNELDEVFENWKKGVEQVMM